MKAFLYTPQNLAQIEQSVSSERLAPYLADASGSLNIAVKLYEQNTLLSESLYGVLQGLEVALRNGMHTELAAGFRNSSWWMVANLGPDQQDMLVKAQHALTREGKPLDAGRVVAELSFGFWTSLFGRGYTDLWRNHLVKVFPRRSLQRADVQTRLNSIRKLRNRVAHHEIILHRSLQRDVNQIVDTISWINPSVAWWIRSNSSFDARYLDYRRQFLEPALQTLSLAAKGSS